MKKWDKEEDNLSKRNVDERNDNPRYRIDLTKEGIRLTDLYTGNVKFGSLDGKSFGGKGKARDFNRSQPDRWTAFYNKNFSWKEYCESELGIEYVS